METEPQRKRLLLVDGHAYAYRAFHAIQSLAGPDGRPTNAIYGFIKMLQKLRTILQPTHLAVVWDGGLAEARLKELAAYKAQRPEMPSGLAAQLDDIQAYLGAAGLTSLCENGVEADDWLGTLARQAESRGWEVVIASSDKDFMQLVSPLVSLFNPNDKSEIVWDAGKVRNKTGVNPEQIVDWLSLIGDAVDNIPGVEGVGPKTATTLLTQFGSAAELYRRLDEVSSERLRERLKAGQGDVERNCRLIRLHDINPGDRVVETFQPGAGDSTRLLGMYSRWGFNTLRKELEVRTQGQGNLF